MEPRNIVFLSRSIFVEGVVSRLRQRSTFDSIHFIDPDSSDFMERIFQFNPNVVVIDTEIGKESQVLNLCELLTIVPTITILRLQAHKKDIQVIKSSQYFVKDIQDLIDLLENHM